MWYLRYPLADGSGHVTVATTRPETMLGDTAVAVNPDDPRAADLAGKTVTLPIVGREIPIVTDDYVVMADPDSSDAKARALRASMMISADMAHALHPNYADRHEPDHAPLLGAGPVIKTNANQRYATDGEMAARFTEWCEAADVRPQQFVTRSDLGCGSTIGPITASRLGVRTIDVGSPMLSMHSAREMCAAADVAPMIAVMRRFFEEDR